MILGVANDNDIPPELQPGAELTDEQPRENASPRICCRPRMSQ